MSSIAKNCVNIEDQHEVVNVVVGYEIEEISAARMGVFRWNTMMMMMK
jgi:hypothetical protein